MTGPHPPVPPLTARPAAAPLPAQVHPQLLRGPAHRWWRPLLAAAIVVGVPTVLLVWWVVVAVVVSVAMGREALGSTDAEAELWFVTPAGLLVTNLSLAAAIPLSQLAVWAGHRCRPGLLSSVRGRLRWRWLLVCAGLAAAVQLPLTVALMALDPGARLDPEPRWLLLAVVVLVTTPLQAAGEEYFFRGWLSQAAGSLAARAGVSALVAAAVSAPLFALAHGSQGPWLYLDRLAFGLVASYLAWRTGGLEAPIGLHAVNNLTAFGGAIALGELSSALEVADVPAWSAAYDVAVMAVITVLVVRLARRRGIERLRPAAAVAS